MTRMAQRLVSAWVALGPRFMPFADIATPDLPLHRLLRLSLFQVSVGMALVLLVGTLNRVMIVELGVSAALVGAMLALPLVFAPFRALIGHRSDHHQCELGWRRVPFIWKGTLWQFAGFAIMPFALLVLSGLGEAATAPRWVGQGAAALSFLLVGAGLHTVQTAGLALATDLTQPQSQPRVVGLMYVALLLGMLVSALVFGYVLQDFSPGRLVQVIQGAALCTLVLNAIAMWKQESRRPRATQGEPVADPSFAQSWRLFSAGAHARRLLWIIGIGTMGFTMADILLEPFGGQVLQLSVSSTTALTAVLAAGGLLGFGCASNWLGAGSDAHRMARWGALLGVPAFVLVIASAPLQWMPLFWMGNFCIGFAGALFGHATLTATMLQAPPQQTGLALGAWGAVQATAAGVGMALSGALRDLVNLWGVDLSGVWPQTQAAATGYLAVYSLEIVLLILAVALTAPLVRSRRPAPESALASAMTAPSGSAAQR